VIIVHRNGGFSLVEVMCAILILGIALVGLTLGITTALSSSKESELQTTAALLAAGQMEMIRADGLFTDGVKEGDCGDDLPLYRWKQTISSTSITGLHEVEVVVENSNSGQAIYELRTLLFDPSDPVLVKLNEKKKDSAKSKKKKGRKE
jgi:prepilin-type N-terminal cleavage/methylation domain-containing protein